MLIRLAAPALLVGLLVGSCGNKDKEGAPSATGSASAPAPAVVPLAKLATIPLPTPNGVPAGLAWTDDPKSTDGHRMATFGDDAGDWYYLQLIDCRAPEAKAAATQPDAELKAADLDAFLGQLDLAAVARL